VALCNNELCLCEIRIGHDGDKVNKTPGYERVVLTQTDRGCEHAHDLDIATHYMCPQLRWDPHKSQALQVNNAPDCSVLIIRKSYISRPLVHPLITRVPTGDPANPYIAYTTQGVSHCYPATLTVSGVVYVIRHAEELENSDYCFGLPAGCDMVRDAMPARLRGHTCVVAGEGRGVALVDPTTNKGVLFANGIHPVRFGQRLMPQVTGEVYQGLLLALDASAPRTPSHPLPIFCSNGSVAVKLVRYPNEHLPHAATKWFTTDYVPARAPALFHHEAVERVTTTHVFPHLDHPQQTENPVRETVVSRYTEQEVHRAIQEFSAQQQHATVPDPTYLRDRFTPIREASVSCENLHLVTDYAAFGCVEGYMSRSPVLPHRPLSERAAKHVLRHLLQALVFIHERGLAHRDLSLTNIVLSLPTSGGSDLLQKRDQWLTDDEFERLNVALIDFGQAVAHPVCTTEPTAAAPAPVPATTSGDASPCPDGLTVQLRAMGLTAVSADDDPRMDQTSECDSGVTTNESFSPRSPVPTVARSKSSSSVTSPLSAPSSFREDPPLQWYGLLPAPDRPVGKESHRPPELQYTTHEAAALPAGEAAPAPYCGRKVDMWQAGVMLMNMFTGMEYQYFLQKKARQAAAARQGAPGSGAVQRPVPSPESPVKTALKTLYLHARCDAVPFYRVGRLRSLEVSDADPIPAEDVDLVPLEEVIPAQPLDLLGKLLVADPARRLTAAQALQHPWFQEVDRGTEQGVV
jgi:serine/threonine protein kinase